MLLYVLVVVLMLGQKGFLNGLRIVWKPVYYVVLAVWDAAMVYSFIAYLLGFSLPELLSFPEFFVAGVGFSSLYNMSINSQREARRRDARIISILRLIVGGTALFTGKYTIMFKAPNFFAYICLIIGTILIVLSAKQIRAGFLVPKNQ